MRSRLNLIEAGALACVLAATSAFAQPGPGQELIEEREGSVLRPSAIQPTRELVEQLRVPAGFEVNVFAEGLGAPRMLAVGPDGTVYVTRRDPGEVTAMRDEDGDGVADRTRVAVDGIDQVHGIAIDGGRMYLADVRNVYVAEMGPEGVGEPERIIDNLPPGGQHPNRTLAVGPDGKLYITVGSTCNACVEEHPWSATILRSDLDGANIEVFAEGLRNTLGIGWHPVTRAMWGMDNGTDWLGDREPPEELNRLMEGHHYGWPFAYGENNLVRTEAYPEGFEPRAWLDKSTPSVLAYPAHSAPLQMAMYTAEAFPEAYRGDAFVAMHGSWNRQPPVGYEIARVEFDERGEPQRIEPFVEGFLLRRDGDRWAYFGRPAGIAVGADGSLLVSDDAQGVIYRIAWVGEEADSER